ncbi:MAG: serine hydrolase [Anaerolineaceae bacterium]|nr:serine hydrolase [Anaerolineaceae bacterium]
MNVSHINDGQGLADGGIISNAKEVAAFIRELNNGELLSEDSMKELRDWVGGNEYGLGYSYMTVADWYLEGHDGATSGFASEMWFVPEESTTVIILFGSEDMEADSYRLIDSALTYWFNK